MNERLKKLRKTLDLTQQEFANRIGSSQNVLANYESGRRNPSSSVINNICKTFNVNEVWLRTGDGDMFLETDPDLEAQITAVIKELGLDDAAARFTREYFHLSERDRAIVKQFIQSLLDAQPAPGPEKLKLDPADIDVEAEVAAYRAELEAQKKARAGLFPSGGQGAG